MTVMPRPSSIRAAGCLLALMLCAASQAAEPALDLAPYRGRVVVVDFWASWCKPCRQSIPWLNGLRDRYGPRGLVIIGVNVDAERADANRFLREVPIAFEVVYDPAGVIARKFDVQGMPSSFVFDRNGALVRTHLGFRENRRSEHEAEIEALLSRNSQ
jgi:cytochrome c biogenesis protein CcmG, thiol:disulfide interchange protein DsbE